MTFDRNTRAALADAQLRGALRHATNVFGERRRAALAAFPDWEQARSQARAIKDEALLHLDRYLDEFTSNAARAGASVHRARDAASACDIIGGIALQVGARTVVKSKSMATEEIHLNAALTARGLEPVETDLGEYIIQLAGETPSHIVAPAIHKSKAQIAALFVEKLGMEPTDDVAALTAAARRALRRRFAEAAVGISGVNFAVAETGTILIVENEGNARLTTSLPQAHIAVMGIEKVIPRFADLEVFLRLLPRAGTGQVMTAYVSLITGAKRRPVDEGPAELHIVILDNGRSAMLASPVTRQTLACIRCGACLNACPVYRQIGGHAYGSVYPGPIGAVLTPQLFGVDRAPELPYASSLCGACRDVCPIKIDIPQVLLHLRAQVVERGAGKHPWLERLAFRGYAGVMTRPRLFEWVVRAIRALRITPPLRAWTRWRDLRPLAPRSFREQWRDGLGAAGRGTARQGAAGKGAEGRGTARKGAPVSDRPAAPSRALARHELTARFTDQLKQSGARWTIVRGEADTARALAAILTDAGARRIAGTDAPLVQRLLQALGDRCVSHSVERLSRDELFACDVGLTTAQLGIAETGTLVLESARERSRLVSLVPPIHVALLPTTAICESLGDALARVREPGPSGPLDGHAITFITGPSRTSDIELTPVIGVHGPQTVHVLLLEEDA